MEQNNLIAYVKEIKDAELARTVVYPQLPDFSSDHIGIRPLKIRPLFFQERQVRGNLCPRFFVQTVKEFIYWRIARLGCIQNKTVQERLRVVLPLYIIFDVLSSCLFPPKSPSLDQSGHQLTLLSRLRYWIASEMCSDAIVSLPSMSAMVRATL